eukprot:gene13879-biopygen20071
MRARRTAAAAAKRQRQPGTDTDSVPKHGAIGDTRPVHGAAAAAAATAPQPPLLGIMPVTDAPTRAAQPPERHHPPRMGVGFFEKQGFQQHRMLDRCVTLRSATHAECETHAQHVDKRHHHMLPRS